MSNSFGSMARVEMQLNFSAAEFVNLNQLDQSAPIQIYLIPLKSDEKFISIPEATILNDPYQSFGADLGGSVQEIILAPGEKRTLKVMVPCPGYLGILGNFRKPAMEENNNRRSIPCVERGWLKWFPAKRNWQIDLFDDAMRVRPQ